MTALDHFRPIQCACAMSDYPPEADMGLLAFIKTRLSSYGRRAAFSAFCCDDVAINLQPEPGGKTVAVMLREEGAKQRLGACAKAENFHEPRPGGSRIGG
jgi:hypothetical protein